MTTTTSHLSQIVDLARSSADSSEAIALAKLRVMDFIAASCDGLLTDTSTMFDRYAKMSGGHAGATVLATGQRTTALLASAANAATGHAAETDDIHVDVTGLHAGAVVIPAAWAAAESAGVSGRQFLQGVVAGYEVAGRIGAAMNASHRARGFHATGTVGVLGAAAAASISAGDTDSVVISSIGLSTSMAGGTFSVLAGGAQAKHLHPAHAAMSGVWAADLARLGLDAAPTALEVTDGYFSAYADAVDEVRLLGSHGSPEIARVLVKPLPCCAHAYGAVEAAFALRDHANLDRLTAIKIETYHAASVLANRAPTSRAEAKLSLPYCVVAALREPALTEESFSDEAIDRVAKDPLMALISIEDSTWSNAAFPSRRLTRLSLADRAGAVSSFDAEVLHRPTKNRDVIDQKFRASVEPVLGSAIDELIDLIEHLDTKVDSLAHLTKFFSQTASSYRGGHRFI
ncbi:MAG: hypothetical protein RJA58_688 [Pseudomonadota bacterium]